MKSMENSKYYIDFVDDGMYNVLVRRSDGACLYSNDDLENVVSEARKMGVGKEELVIY